MLSPISFAFKNARKEKRPALLTYTVAGDNSKKQSLEILKSISKNADILEVGMPHNTPVADGSQIQTREQTTNIEDRATQPMEAGKQVGIGLQIL